jgi:hypothetical protein
MRDAVDSPIFKHKGFKNIQILFSMESLRENCEKTIQEVCEKYKENPYMLQRIRNHIINYLPNTLEYELKNHEKRVLRANYLSNEQQTFIEIFLSKHQYYYLPSSNYFYEYNGTNYLIIKEDTIIYNLLSSISKDRVLMQWKHRTKSHVIKQIRDRNLFNCIPESDTIQRVLNLLYPSIFPNKNHAKYFLTVIGDNILKKNSHLIFLINQKTKRLLNEIHHIACSSISNINVTHNFMCKYHENHSYENCRLLKINDCFSFELWEEHIHKIGLNLLCVAAHYSNRYENSDTYIDSNMDDDEFKSYVLYLKKNTQKVIINKFCKYCIQSAEPANVMKIEWKNLHFIWKQYLSGFSFPNMIYSNTLKHALREKYEYDEESDTFLNITSKFLPVVCDFISFWENNMICNTINTAEELELDEISMLFTYWIKQNNSFVKNMNISEDYIQKIIIHFFPHIEILEDKFILNISCSIWNKMDDIHDSFDFIKQTFQNKNTTLLSMDDAYNYYCRFMDDKSSKFIVSKRYFEKYLYVKIPEFIVYDTFINNQWFL